jgi:hypothetical protein
MKTIKTKKLEVPKDPNQRLIMQLYPRRVALRKSLAPSYYPIKHHIYYDGNSFRVRVVVDGERISVNTTDKREAIRLRDELLTKKV